MEILRAMSRHLEGIAWKTRAVPWRGPNFFIYYLRQVIRHRWFNEGPDFELEFRLWLEKMWRFRRDDLLKALEKEKKAGGEEFKESFRWLLQHERVIPRPVFKAYKKYFVGSRLTTFLWARYNTDLLAKVAATEFLNGVHRFNRFCELKKSEEGDSEVFPVENMRHIRFVSVYAPLHNAFLACGMMPEMWGANRNERIEFDYNLTPGFFSDAFWVERFGLKEFYFGIHFGDKSSLNVQQSP